MSKKSNEHIKKNITEIAPLLAYHFLDMESNALDFEPYNQMLVLNAPQLGRYYKYLGRLHDSWILETKLSDGNFSIVLNDFATHVLADVLVERQHLKIEHQKLVFPIELVFETMNLTFNTVDDEGNIQCIDSVQINEYLFEQILSFDNHKIEMAIVVWTDGNMVDLGQRILILLSVKNIRVTERQDIAWREIFGNTYDNFYAYFKAEFSSGRYLSSYSVCDELYDEYTRQHKK